MSRLHVHRHFSDALCDGGARVQGVRIRDGFYFDDCGNRIVYSMMKADGSVKGIRTILSE